jgi:peptidyl-prolyl cis-trans isomerase C
MVPRALVAVLLAAGCSKSARVGVPAAAGAPGKAASGEGAQVVARIDGEAITVDDVQRKLSALDAYSRARYSAPEQKKKFLESLVRFEVLAREAQSRGYDKDPVVQQALKNQMIAQFLQKEVDAKLRPEDFSEAEVDRYYREHPEEFRQPEQVRVSQIFTAGRPRAEQAAAEARALTGRSSVEEEKLFRDLVGRYSEDEDSKSRGGDLTFFDRATGLYPKAVVEAAFALKEIGEVSGPVHSERGYHVLLLTQRRPGFTRPREDAGREIRRQLAKERRARKMEEMVTEMRQRLKVQIFEDQLAKVAVDRPAGGAR